jgi:hypothetical protein
MPAKPRNVTAANTRKLLNAVLQQLPEPSRAEVWAGFKAFYNRPKADEGQAIFDTACSLLCHQLLEVLQRGGVLSGVPLPGIERQPIHADVGLKAAIRDGIDWTLGRLTDGGLTWVDLELKLPPRRGRKSGLSDEAKAKLKALFDEDPTLSRRSFAKLAEKLGIIAKGQEESAVNFLRYSTRRS